MTSSAMVLPPTVAQAAGRCETALSGRTAVAVTLGLLAGLGLLGVALAIGVILMDPQAEDQQRVAGAESSCADVSRSSCGAAPVAGVGGADA